MKLEFTTTFWTHFHIFSQFPWPRCGEVSVLLNGAAVAQWGPRRWASGCNDSKRSLPTSLQLIRFKRQTLRQGRSGSHDSSVTQSVEYNRIWDDITGSRVEDWHQWAAAGFDSKYNMIGSKAQLTGLFLRAGGIWLARVQVMGFKICTHYICFLLFQMLHQLFKLLQTPALQI